MSLFGHARRAPTMPLSVFFVGWWFFRIVNNVVLTLLYRPVKVGVRNIPREGPILYVANHQSNFDPPIVGISCYDRPYMALGRSTLFSFKPFAWIITMCGTIPLKQGEGDRTAIRKAIEIMAGGGCILVFPEGTRTIDGTTGPFQAGIMTILKRVDAQVVPVAVEGSHDVWGRRSRPSLRGRLAVSFGVPQPSRELLEQPSGEALEALRRQIETMRLELRATLRQKSRGRFPPAGVADRPYWEQAPE